MSKSTDIAALFDQYVMHTYAPTATLTSGSGCKVRDPDGKTYLDFTSGIAVHNVGHCHPKVVKAVQDQVATLGHCSNLFYNVNQALLAQRLSKLSLNGKCFFCNSGAEANEAMIKLARLWGHEKGKFEVITMQNSFHGRTLATIAATGQAKVQKGYDPLPIGFAYAEFNNLESVAAAVNERTVAVMLEAVQGEGGVIPATEEFMAGVRRLCDEKGLLMLCDEVQCGMGRTGKWFGWQNYSVKPDAFTLAKSLADGIPMGALVASPALSDIFTPGTHASTFGGNPVSSAAALAVLNVIEEEALLKRAEETGALFVEGLNLFVEKHKQVLEIRGKGLMLGMVVEGSAKEVVDMCREMGLLCCVAGEHVVRFLPPLNIKESDLEEALEMIGDALDELYGGENGE
ncbi:MAG TPA: aspartate aminotransferase family protein [Kiritimatiellia bacterium]|nr:aspartate aminotransferase family protein [Kiritimatiellia bacterium]HRU70125.1 aspartate aminotransferase family protein [Kiritimatiellia bacterium]